MLKIECLEDFVAFHDEMLVMYDFIKHLNNVISGASIAIRNVLSDNISLGLQCLSYF